MAGRESLSASEGLNRFHGQKNRPSGDVGCLTYSGSVSLVRGDNSSRGRLQPFQAVQQSANAGRVPFAAKCRWYLSRVQLARDGTKRNEVLSPQCSNCRSQSLGSRICGLLVCQSIVDPVALAVRNQAQARQYPHHGGVAPATAAGGRYSSSVQLIRQRTARNEASRHKLLNGRGQSKGAGVCGSIAR